MTVWERIKWFNWIAMLAGIFVGFIVFPVVFMGQAFFPYAVPIGYWQYHLLMAEIVMWITMLPYVFVYIFRGVLSDLISILNWRKKK